MTTSLPTWSNAPVAPVLPSDARPSAVEAVDAPSKVRRWTSQELLQSAREVEIEHDNMVYRLRITATGKLILTK